MSHTTQILALFFVLILGVESVFIPPPPPISSHDQLKTNSEKWMDYFRTTPLGKMYHLYHDTVEAGLPIHEFSLYEYDDNPNFQFDEF